MKTELITNVSHDIKTPLTAIVNYVDLLEKEDIQPEKARGICRRFKPAVRPAQRS
ncbi:MAG: histidine kinase dimerization/phospho-acceptor domain-containing protein [Acutalibacteraceae bacterium]